MNSNFILFLDAYSPTEKAADGQKANCMVALNSTVASVSAREYVFGLTDVNAREGKGRESGGEADITAHITVLGAHGRDMLNDNGKLLLGCAEDNKLSFLSTFFRTSKRGVSYTSQSTNPSKGRARLDFILTKQEDHRLVRWANVRRSPLKTLGPDHNLVYAKARIPRGSVPNRKRRKSTKETLRTVDSGG